MRRILLRAATAALVASLGIVPGALAAGPVIEHFEFTDSFQDDLLSEECGVDVTTTVDGSRTTRTFDRASGVQLVNTVNVSLVATAGDRTFRFRDVGADVMQDANGTLTLLIIGQVPFDFSGVLKIDVATGEVVLEPHWVDTSRACRALAG